MDDAWPGILAINGDGTGKAQRLLQGVNIPFSTTPDGSRVAYYKMGVDTVFDLWTAPLSRDAKGGLAAGEPELFRQTPFVETYPAFSPNGKWIAYASNESGWFEVYVRAFPDTGSGVKVSSNGGRVAAWTPTHIYYSTSDQRIMSAAWRVEGGRFQVDPPKQWTQVRLADTGVLSNYSMSPDGKVAVGLVWPGPQIERGNRLTVVQDVFAELRRGPR
jgi:serine/threonine-protein kinase